MVEMDGNGNKEGVMRMLGEVLRRGKGAERGRRERKKTRAEQGEGMEVMWTRKEILGNRRHNNVWFVMEFQRERRNEGCK